MTTNKVLDTEQALTLVLPLPPTPNRSGKTWYGRQANKDTYRMECWAEAVRQATPVLLTGGKVEVTATFFIRNLRDEDNLDFSLKWVLDALKRNQRGKIKWKGNDVRGFFEDDSPGLCTIRKPTQSIDRKRPRLELTISPVGSAPCIPKCEGDGPKCRTNVCNDLKRITPMEGE